MRFHGILLELTESKSKIAILMTLLKYPGKVFSGREIARLTGVSKTRTAEILTGLEANNIVNRKTIGITNEWSVNRESILVKYLSRYFLQLDSQILENLKNDIKMCFNGMEEISKVTMYGSVARGDETHYSDIDLLILLKKQDKKRVLKKVAELNLMTLSKYGNPVSAGIYTEKEFAKVSLTGELKNRIDEEGIILMER